MKSKIFRISKRTISLLLSIIMVFSMMLVGMVTTNATKNSFTKGDTIYFDISSQTGWASGADIVAIFYYQDKDNWCYESNSDTYRDDNINNKPTVGNYTSVTALGNNCYSVTVPASNLGSVRFLRKSAGGTNLYNYTARMTADNKGSNNCVKLSGWDNSSTWSTYSQSTTSSDWYLSGFLNNTDISVGNNAYKFSSTSTDNVYELEITFTSAHNNGQYITINNGTYIYGTNTSDELLDENGTDTSDYGATGKWFVPIQKDVKVKFTWNASTNTISWSKVATWYLSGFLNNTDISVGNNAYKFSSTSTDNVYELEITFTSAHNNGQYITINNGTYIYGTNTSDELLDENGTDTSDYGATGKWFVPIQKDVKVKFTWNASTNTISWSKVATTYTVSASAQYRQSSGSTYSTLSGATPTVTTSPVTSGGSTNISAPTVSGYTFETWAIASGSGTFGSATSQSTTFNPTANSTLYARYIKQDITVTTHTVSVSAGEGGSAYISQYVDATGATVTNTDTTVTSVTAKSGTSVTFTAVPSSGYEVSAWGSSSSTSTTYTTTVNSDTTISVTFASTSGGGSTPAVDKTTKIDNVYLIYGTDNNPANMTNYINLYLVNGEAIAYFSEDVTGFKAGTEYYFALSGTAGGSTAYQHMYWQSWYNEGYKTFNVKVNDEDLFASYSTQSYNANDENNQSRSWQFPKFKTNDLAESVQISVGTYGTYVEGNTYTIRAFSSISEDYAKVYAKDGTIRSTDNYAYQKYANMADSTFTSNVEKISSDTYYESGYAKKGSTITVNTTISENYRSTYYVKAFSVNGVSYSNIDSSKADKTNGVYTLTYTVPDDFSDKFIEITPIYFYINETDTATFYVENFNDEVQAEWGNTIACHAYYEGGSDTAGFGASNKNALGGYPGQPMVNEGGKLYVQVPLHLDSEKKIKIKGITLNNYVWDDIHSIGKDQKNDNCQTYDYDDFVRIADLGTADNIIFTFKYRTSVDNSPSTVPNDTNKDAVFTNGWEDLTDYYGRKVDVFGNILSDTQISSSTPLRIVSNGYIDNHIGDYATEWNIYALNGSKWSKIATIPSSVLLYPTSGDIPTEASDYKTAYTALEAYENVPAIITYEKSIESKGSGGQLGDRADGRWYYSKTGDIVTSNIVIEYADDEKSTFVEDEFKDDTVVGTITGASAYFTNSEYYGTTSITTVLDSSQYFNLHTEENATTGYMFYGWYLKNTDGTYTWMSNDADYNVPISGSDTFVARYIKIPEGDLLITHTLYSSISDLLTQYTGDDVPNTGSGNCYLKVEILDASGNVVRTFGSETSTASVHLTSNYIKYDSDYSIQVYIYTDPLGNDDFLQYYVNNHKPAYTDRYCKPMTNFIQNDDGTAYLKMPAFTVKSLFKVTETDSGTTYENTVSSLDFYSDIAPVTKDYKITYTYDSRLYGEKDYVVKGVIDSVFIETYGTDELTADFVKKNAPFVDDFGKKITWDLDNIVIKNESDVATAAVSSSKDVHYVTLTSVGSDGSEGNTLTFAYGALAKHGNIKKGTPDTTGEDDDFIYIADAENTDGEKFNHWAIYNNEGKLVSRCYSASFNYVLYDNYTIKAVYGDDYSKYEDISSTIDLLEYTRNQWTDEDGNKKGDYLYSDFALAYNYNHNLISSLDPSNVEVGIAFEVCGKIVQEPDGTYDNSDLEMKYGAGITTNDEALKSAILASTVNGKTTYNVDDSTKRNLFCYQIANEKLNNKNRIEYYLEFKNTESNQMYIMKVYSYIIVDGKITLSKPEYINLYDIANCEYVIG